MPMHTQRGISSTPLHDMLFLSFFFLFLTAAPSSSGWVLQTKEVITQPFNKNKRVSNASKSNPISNNQRHSHHEIAMLMLSVDQVQEFISEAASMNPTAAEEGAILNDLSEVSSDLAVLLAPETIILRLANVIGKILEVLSDYLPDHSLRSDELAFNLPVMVTSIFLLSRSAGPILKAQFVELDYLDLDAFELCFQPVGVTLLQYKCMKATGCFEWITCEAGTILIDEEEYNEYDASSLLDDIDDVVDDETICCPADWKYLYWQFDGDVIRSFKGNIFGFIERTNGKHIDNPEAQGLLGDTRFLSSLEEKQSQSRGKQKQNTRNGRSSNDIMNNQLLHPIDTIQIGPAGARLLRIDGHKLLDLMDHDERLESSIRLLLLKSLRLKIGNLLLAQQEECQFNINLSDDSCEGRTSGSVDKDTESKENEATSLGVTKNETI